MLQEQIFPRLRELCQLHGASEEAGLDQQTTGICVEEIARCRRVNPRPDFSLIAGLQSVGVYLDRT